MRKLTLIIAAVLMALPFTVSAQKQTRDYDLKVMSYNLMGIQIPCDCTYASGSDA